MGVGSVISSISTLGGLVVWISLKLKLNGLNVDLSVVVVLWVVVLGSWPTRPYVTTSTLSDACGTTGYTLASKAV